MTTVAEHQGLYSENIIRVRSYNIELVGWLVTEVSSLPSEV
jgi:hypothetical protein